MMEGGNGKDPKGTIAKGISMHHGIKILFLYGIIERSM